MNLKKVGHLTLEVPKPFDLALTVAKPAGWHWSTPKEVFDSSKKILWSGFYNKQKPVGVKLFAIPSKTRGTISIRAFLYGRGKFSKDERGAILTNLKLGLGMTEDLKSYYKFAKKDRLLKKIVEELNGMRVGWLDDVFGRIILSISLQMTTLKRSESMMDGLLKKYGTKISFDNHQVILWPTPRRIVKLTPAKINKAANMGYRAKFLIAASNYLITNPLSMSLLNKMTEDEARVVIDKIPGIGEYSTSIILGRSVSPVDVWSATIMSELLTGKTPKKPRAAVEKIIRLMNQRFGVWSWLSFVYILNDLDNIQSRFKLSRIT